MVASSWSTSSRSVTSALPRSWRGRDERPPLPARTLRTARAAALQQPRSRTAAQAEAVGLRRAPRRVVGRCPGLLPSVRAAKTSSSRPSTLRAGGRRRILDRRSDGPHHRALRRVEHGRGGFHASRVPDALGPRGGHRRAVPLSRRGSQAPPQTRARRPPGGPRAGRSVACHRSKVVARSRRTTQPTVSRSAPARRAGPTRRRGPCRACLPWS